MESNFLNSQPDLKEIIDLDMNVEIEKNRRISTYDSFSIDKIMELYKSSCLDMTTYFSGIKMRAGC